MRFSDILRMCLDSLKRRKGRTTLTVLGVFIGCVSIILMVSIGAGMRESTEQMIEGMGDIKIIEVYGSSGEAKLDDDAINSFREIEGVDAVMPKLSVGNYNVSAKTGTGDRYTAGWMNLQGLDLSEMEKMGYELLDGKYPGGGTNEVVVGQYFAYNFTDSFLPEGRNYRERYKWDDQGNQLDPDEPFFNPIGATIKVTFMSYEDSNKTETIEFKVVGILKEDYGKGWETSEGMIIDNSQIKSISAKLDGVPEAKQKLSYNTVNVRAADISSIPTIEETIKNGGYYTYSMESMRQELEKETRQIELILGGLGAISLLVAAIGIANTMVMSISERTKEIGIMKAIGCYIKDIRLMFLLEAGLIGLIGGVCGLLFSYLVSIGINLYSFGVLDNITIENIKYALLGNPDMARVSVITLPLAVFALVFSFMVGVVSGYSPADKAVKIPALEAIRNE